MRRVERWDLRTESWDVSDDHSNTTFDFWLHSEVRFVFEIWDDLWLIALYLSCLISLTPRRSSFLCLKDNYFFYTVYCILKNKLFFKPWKRRRGGPLFISSTGCTNRLRIIRIRKPLLAPCIWYTLFIGLLAVDAGGRRQVCRLAVPFRKKLTANLPRQLYTFCPGKNTFAPNYEPILPVA